MSMHSGGRFNPDVPAVYLQQACVEIVTPRSNDPISENHRIHDRLVSGFRAITYVDDAGQETTPTIRLLTRNAGDNDWLVAGQVTVRRGDYHRRFDLVLYGVRIGEAIAVDWNAIDMDRATVEIDFKILRVKGAGLLRVRRTKSDAGHRTLPLPLFAVRDARTPTGRHDRRPAAVPGHDRRMARPRRTCPGNSARRVALASSPG